ncbi:MAG: NifU family protein [Nitrospirae bacterium]|nr:NifU family protein [Nitrospirota bacterium]MBI3593520.1 NifU family protein [Nitrospirota bacterium]
MSGQENHIEIPIVTFTKGAIDKIRDSLLGKDKSGIRLTVLRQGGEFVYQFSYVEREKVNPNDVLFHFENCLFIIDHDSVPLIRGAQIDYLLTGLTQAWVIDNPNPAWDSEISIEIAKIFDEQINPGVAEHGGHIKLVGLKEHIAYVEMSGGCQGCSMAGKTLRHGVMKILSEKFPQITELIDVTDHHSGTKPYFQSETGSIPTFKS